MGRAIDFERAIKLPLLAVPLNIANGDGSCRETIKNELMHVINPKRNVNFAQAPSEKVSNFVINFIALVQILTVIPKIFENLIWKTIKMLPARFITLHVVADSYREVSIKSVEKKKRGITPKIYVKWVSSNVPRELQQFFQNSDNKSRLIELFIDDVIQKRYKVLNVTIATKILLSKDGLCRSVTSSSTTEMTDLSSNHEEAVTKVILHCVNAFSASGVL